MERRVGRSLLVRRLRVMRAKTMVSGWIVAHWRMLVGNVVVDMIVVCVVSLVQCRRGQRCEGRPDLYLYTVLRLRRCHLVRCNL